MSLYSESNISTTGPPDLYEEDLNEDTALDLCSKNLTSIPSVNNNSDLCALYLQDNKIATIPDDFFPSLPNLMWLDLRDNELVALPSTIQEHRSLTHLLLQNNKITDLPTELGTVPNLKVLQLAGNPIVYPPKEIISAGISKILTFLFEKHFDEHPKRCPNDSEDTLSNYTVFNQDSRSYNSVLDGGKLKNNMSIKFTEKDLDDSDDECYSRIKGKCPKLAKSRFSIFPSYHQSSKYLGANYATDKTEQTEKIKRSYLKDMALKKHKDLVQAREKILQDRKSIELLSNWRHHYRLSQLTTSSKYLRSFPYDTDPELMTLLSREDIERDLPDKYRRRLVRRSRPSVPRQPSSDVHLALKIKQLFEHLEGIDLARGAMTPRTEQQVLLGEIHKISEIKQKLMELSTTNSRSVALD